MLDYQVVNVDFTNGVNKKSPDELGVPARLLALDDALFDLAGNLNVRPGYSRVALTGMSGSATPAAPNRLNSWKKSLLLEDLSTGWFRMHALGAQQLRMDPTLVNADVSQMRTGYRAAASQTWVGGAAALGSNTTDFSYALGNGWRYYAWKSDTVRYRVESPDGAVVLEGALFDTAGVVQYSTPRIVFDSASNTAFLFCVEWDGATTYTLEARAIPQSTMALGNPVAVAALTSAKLYDVHFNAVLTVAWYGASKLHQAVLRDLDGSISVAREFTPAGTPALLCAYSGGLGKCYVFWHEGGTAVKGAYYKNDGSAAGSATTLGTASGTGAAVNRLTAVDDGSKVYVVYDNVPSGAYVFTDVVKLRMLATDDVLSATSKETDICGGFALQGRALFADGRYLLPVLFRDATAPGFFLIDWTWHALTAPASSPWVPPHIVARPAWGEASDAQVSTNPLPEIQRPAANRLELVFTRWSPTLDVVGATNVTARRMVRMDLAIKSDAGPLGSAEMSDLLYLAGACPHVFDGSAVVEEGFNTRPIIRSAAASGSGGGLSAGSYSLIAVYEWIDRQGNTWFSPPSDPFPMSASATNGYSVSVSALRATRKAGVRIVIFRTTVDADVYYRDGDVANNTGTSSITFNDSAAVTDDVLQAGTQVYTSGGRLESIPMPPCRQIAVHQRRMFVAGGSDDFEFWYSDQPAAKFAPAFNDVLRFSVPSNWGRLVGMAPVDDKLVLIAENILGIIFGDGPNAAGEQNGYSEPSPVLQAAGVKWGTPNAIATTDEGVWFQTERGMRLLSRGMSLQATEAGALGADVDAYLAGGTQGAGSNVVAVLQPPGEQHAYFYTSTGFVLVFDRYFRQWSRFTNANGSLGACLAFAPGTLALVQFFTGGTYLNEGFDGAVDPGSVAVSPLAETAWFKLAGVQGFQRVRDVGLLGSGTVSVRLGVDYTGTYSAPHTLAMGTTVSNGRFPATVQKCEAMRVKITGFSTLRSIALRVGVKRGMVKLPYTRYA